MAFSINTNVVSLQAQNALRLNSNFQQKTINRVTSGLRIVNSGDDAAGLAIANGMRSDEAVLTQGIANANDGLSQLQIADGGMSNISQLLDRARTLATQSASGTFTGDRSVLNSEFQSVLGEIDRQAQSIGLNVGGTFAKSLQVFIGGGKGDSSGAVITNGSVDLDLSKSTIDTQSLGLKGFVAGYAPTTSTAPDSGFYDLGSSSSTSVDAIMSDTNNSASRPTSTTFTLAGPGFTAGANGAATVTVNLANVSDTTSLVNAINAGIQSSELAGTPAAEALKKANIAAEIHTGTDGHQQLLFTSSGAAFQVTAGDKVMNAFMGNVGGVAGTDHGVSADGADPTASAAASFISAGTQQISTTWAATDLTGDTQTPDSQTLTLSANDSNGKQQTMTVTMTAGTNTDVDVNAAVAAINAKLQGTDTPALQSIIATTDNSGGGIVFTNSSSNPFTVTIGVETGVDSGSGIVVPTKPIATSDNVGVGSTVDISSQATAEQAVSALSGAVAKLGNAQAVVGRGENQFNYAINLAQSQVTNMAAAESQIRDADLAAESANLTKAQILIQAGVAALAQANSAPQQVLTLLQR
ncbi:MAG TPA: flagellin [Bryobacteraceae bacterium]|nr:flagellin [Bryobacteraceae bacterium]